MASNYKKTSKSFAVIVVALIIVIAAIGFVIYDECSSHSKLFENEKFATAVADSIGKTPAALSEKTLSDVKVLNVMYDAERNELTVGAAGKNFKTSEYITTSKRWEELNSEYSDLSADTETDHTAELTALELEMATVSSTLNGLIGDIKTTTVKVEDLTSLNDLKYFTAVEILEISGVPVADSSVFANMKNLVSLLVDGAGLTEVNGLTGLDADKVADVTILESGVSDWSPLNYIEDKVTIMSFYDFGGGLIYPMGTTTLAEKNALDAEAAANAEAEAAEGEAVEDEIVESEIVEDEVVEGEVVEDEVVEDEVVEDEVVEDEVVEDEAVENEVAE